MKHLTLHRTRHNDKETLGVMRFEGIQMPEFYTVERPWLGNKPRVSCIPAGTYKIVPHNWEENPAFRFKKVYRLLNVPGRSAILIHAGNTSRDVIGCIAIGNGNGLLKGIPAVLDSRKAMDRLRDFIGNDAASITIID